MSVPAVRPAGDTREDGDLRAVARGGAANLLGSAVTGVALFAMTVLVTRMLPRTDAGVFFTATSLFLLVTAVGQLGTSTGLVYFVARARALGPPGSIPALVRMALRPVVAVGIVVGLLAIAFSQPLAELVSGSHADQTAIYLRILSVFVPIAGAEVVWLAALRGFGSMRVNAWVELVGRPLMQLALIAVALTTASAGWIALAWALPYAAAAAAAYLFWARRARRVTASGVMPGPTRSEFWTFTGPRGVTGVIQVLMQRFDIVLVAALAGVTQAAIYAAATRFVVVGQMAVTAFTQATQPRLSHTLARHDHAGTNEIYRLSTTWLILLTWPLYLTLLIFRGPLLQVFGRGYETGSSVLVLLSLSMLVATGCGLVDVVLSMAGHTSWNMYNAFGALTCNIVLDILLIPGHGVLGAAIGWSAAICLRNLAAATQVGLALHLHPVARCTLLAAGLTLTAFGVVALLVQEMLGDTLVGLLVAGTTGTVVLVAGVLAGHRTFQLSAFGIDLPNFGGHGRRHVGDDEASGSDGG